MPEILNKNRGESFTIQVIVPEGIVSSINNMSVSLGNNLSAKLSNNTLIQTGNTFLWKIKSIETKNLGYENYCIVSIDLDGYGNRKSKVSTAPKVNFQSTSNCFTNESTSDFVDLTISYSISQEALVVDNVFINVFRGYSALELYRIQNNDNTLTLEDMLEQQNILPYRIMQVVNVGDGDVIEHNLSGVVVAQMVESGQLQGSVWGEYLDENRVTLRTPFFEDIINTKYTGYLLITKLEDLYARRKVLTATNIQDGSVITHNLNGSVLMQFIENGQIQGGIYGQFNNQNSVIFKTPSLEGQLFNGYILCTKLS